MLCLGSLHDLNHGYTASFSLGTCSMKSLFSQTFKGPQRSAKLQRSSERARECVFVCFARPEEATLAGAGILYGDVVQAVVTVSW